MGILVRELNGTNCKSYLLTVGGEATLVDPVRERLATYQDAILSHNLQLRMVFETHTHADHLMLDRYAKEALGVPWIMHRDSPSPLVDRHVVDGDVLMLGGERIDVMHTPGHTPDSVCYRISGAVLSGDTLLIGGSGRTDFPGGDAGKEYDSVVGRLFLLPEETIVYPAHDYKGRVQSTIGEEKRTNLRFREQSRENYIVSMKNLGLPFPKNIEQVLQTNQSGFHTDEVAFPSVSDVASIETIQAEKLRAHLALSPKPLLVDVREPEEFTGELGHIAGCLLIPLDSLHHQFPELAGYADREIVMVCRAGARSATAAAILRHAGFRRVCNLEGGMLAWVGAGFPVER